MEVDSFMQTIVDGLSENINIIFCGSYISIMKELLAEQNPLFGRFTAILRIEEFNYYIRHCFTQICQSVKKSVFIHRLMSP